MNKNNKSGIILITTLIFMSLTFMLAVMICKNGKESLFSGNRYAENEQAYLAAISGIEFIKGQLYKDKDWLLSEENLTKYISVNSNTIKIEKEDDSIIGYILLDTTKGLVSDENYDSKFEIFLKNDSSKKEYKSINNLFNNRNINNDENKRYVPAKSFYAYVKGTSGKTVRYAEALLISQGDKNLNAGNFINGNVKVNSINNNSATSYKEIYNKESPFITINDKNKNKYGKITASGTLEFNSGDNNPSIVLNSENNTIVTSNGVTIGNFKNGNTIDGNDEDASHIQYDQYTEVNNDELKNYSDSTIDNTVFSNLKSGTYVFVNDIDNSQNSKWIYLNNNGNDITNSIANIALKEQIPEENKITSCEGIEFVKKTIELTDQAKDPITIDTRTVKITGKISSDFLNFIVVDKSNKKGYVLSDINTVDFSMKEDSIIKTTGDLYVNGEVTGSGKIYCGKNLTMNAGSQLETKTQSGVAVYAEGNVNIKEAKNLSYDSNKMENIILEEAVKEAKENLNIADETEINLNGRNIVLEETITNSDTTKVFCSFERIKGKRGHHWYDLSHHIKYKVEIKDSSIYIYENENPIPIFTRTFNEIKEQMYSYYYPEEYRQTGVLKIYNDMDDPQKVNTSNYWYYDRGIQTDRITIKDYNRHINNHGPHKENDDNYMGDMTISIDGYLLGIIDINKNKMDNYDKTENKFIAGKHINGQPDHILVSTGDYKGTKKMEHCFTDFAGSNSIKENEQNYSNSTNNEIIAETIQEYVDSYYKKQVGNTEIKGTIFSKQGTITIDGSGGKFNILGALITANSGGNLTINNASYVNMTYDPDYVPFFTNQGILTTTIFESVF